MLTQSGTSIDNFSKPWDDWVGNSSWSNHSDNEVEALAMETQQNRLKTNISAKITHLIAKDL